jgi:hypothetical protein
LVPQSKNASTSANQIGTPVLPKHQDEIIHCRGHHIKLSSPCTPNSSGLAGLPNHPRQQKVSPSKLMGNRHSLGWRHIGTLGIIISDAAYSMIAPTTDACPTLWTSPQAPGRAPSNTDRTAAQVSACHIWEEDVHTYWTCTSVQWALKKQIISVFEPVYLEIFNDNMLRYANISARDMLDHLFETYGKITAVGLEINFEHMPRDWDPQQPVESLIKQIQECADYSEAGGVLIGHPQQINVGYSKILATCHFMSACRRWNFAAARRQHKQM